MTTSSDNETWRVMVRKWRTEEDNGRLFVQVTDLGSVQLLKRLATDPDYKDATDLILNAPTSTAYYRYLQSFHRLKRLRLEKFSSLQNFNPTPENAHPIPCLSLAYTDLLGPSFVDLMRYLGATELELTGIREMDDLFWQKLCVERSDLTSLSIREVELPENFFEFYLPQMNNLKRLSLSAFCRNSSALSALNVSALKNLAWLEIGDVDLEYLPAGFSELKNLKSLKITNTPLRNLTEVPPRTDEHLSRRQEAALDIFSNLRHLDVSNSGRVILPQLPVQMALEILVAKNINVKKLPKCYYTPTLEVLDLSGSTLESLDKGRFNQLKALRELDVSFTQLGELPEKKEGADRLEKLNLRGLTELHQLPEWLSECVGLKELNLGHLHLKEFPSQLLLRRECKVYDEVDSQVWKNELEEDLCRILIGGLRQNTIDPQLLLMNDQALLRRYVEAEDKRPIRRGNLFFLGDPDVGKSRLAELVTEVDLSDWKQFGGMKILDDSLAYENMTLQSGISRKELPSRISKVRVMEMSGYDAAQFIHPFFLTNHSLYVIVLRDGEDVQKRALYWSKLVEAYAPNGHIILAVWYNGVVHHRLDVSLLRLSVWMDEIPEVIYLNQADEDLEWQAELDRMIVRGLHGLMLDTLCLPDAWIRLLSHLEQLLETRMLLPQAMFDQLVDNYIPPKGEDTGRENLKRYLLAFEAGTVGQLAHVPGNQRETGRMLYHTDWLSEGLYLLTQQLYETGECATTVEKVWETLLESAQHSYSRTQAKILLDFCTTHELCAHWPEGSDKYLFPSFMAGTDKDPEVERAVLQVAEQILFDPNAVHYVVHCPLLSCMMLAQLMIKVFQGDREISEANRDGCYFKQTMFLLTFWDGRKLLILGENGAEAELHLYFSSPAAYLRPDEETWHHTVIEHFRTVLELLPEHLVQRYQIAVERTVGNLKDPRFVQRAEISLEDLAGCQRAGYSSYFCGKLNRSYRLQEFTII